MTAMVASMDDETRREAIGLLIGDLGEIQARVLHLAFDQPKAGGALDALACAVDDLEAAVENLRKAVADKR
jgi:hypothetical protein